MPGKLPMLSSRPRRVGGAEDRASVPGPRPGTPAPCAAQAQCLFVDETFFFRAASIS